METASKHIEFSADAMALVQKIIKRYPEGRHKSAVIPILHIAQAEFDGWLSPQTMDYVASVLNITPVEVYEVASFYSMFHLKPVGKCVIEVCHTGPCWLMGAEDIIKYIGNKLGIKPGETTADGKFTLKGVECLAACGNAPMLQIGEKYHEHLTYAKVDKILDEYSQCEGHISHWAKDKIKG